MQLLWLFYFKSVHKCGNAQPTDRWMDEDFEEPPRVTTTFSYRTTRNQLQIVPTAARSWLHRTMKDHTVTPPLRRWQPQHLLKWGALQTQHKPTSSPLPALVWVNNLQRAKSWAALKLDKQNPSLSERWLKPLGVRIMQNRLREVWRGEAGDPVRCFTQITAFICSLKQICGSASAVLLFHLSWGWWGVNPHKANTDSLSHKCSDTKR